MYVGTLLAGNYRVCLVRSWNLNLCKLYNYNAGFLCFKGDFWSNLVSDKLEISIRGNYTISMDTKWLFRSEFVSWFSILNHPTLRNRRFSAGSEILSSPCFLDKKLRSRGHCSGELEPVNPAEEKSVDSQNGTMGCRHLMHLINMNQPLEVVATIIFNNKLPFGRWHAPTKDNGGSETNLTKMVVGLLGNSWVPNTTISKVETSRVLDKTTCWRLNMLKTLGSWTWILNNGWMVSFDLLFGGNLHFQISFGLGIPAGGSSNYLGTELAFLIDGAWFYVIQTRCFSGVEIAPHRVKRSLGILWKGHYVPVDCGESLTEIQFFIKCLSLAAYPSP